MEICIIILLIIGVMVLFNYYEPFIDIIVEGNKYRVLMWYNKYQWNHFNNKYEIVRNYIQLFII